MGLPPTFAFGGTMKLKATLVAMLATLASNASAETLLLNCQITSAEGANPYEWFANPPKSEDALAQALWDSGLASFSLSPPDRWEIDLDNGNIREPAGKLTYWKPAQVDPENIATSYRSVSGSRMFFIYQRQNRALRIIKRLDYESQNAWADRHGKTFPFELSYEYQCTAQTV